MKSNFIEEKKFVSKYIHNGVLMRNSELKILDRTELRILKYRFGLLGTTQEKMTIEEIGKEFGVTRERVRQKIKSGIKKLKIYEQKNVA
jgi:DNA-directed RNA polymerase sigma subunit (sigma70/sigma32)